MGSEGYFINQFLVSHTNKRTDEWGGAYENRMRLPVDIVKAVRQAVGDDFIIMYRLSMLDLIPDGSSWDEIVKVCGRQLLPCLVFVIQSITIAPCDSLSCSPTGSCLVAQFSYPSPTVC
jgi:hypothetical protein